MGLALDEFFRRKAIRELATENGLNTKLFVTAYRSFREYCLSEKVFFSVLKAALDKELSNYS